MARSRTTSDTDYAEYEAGHGDRDAQGAANRILMLIHASRYKKAEEMENVIEYLKLKILEAENQIQALVDERKNGY